MLKNFLSLFLKSKCPLCERFADHCLCEYCLRGLQSYKSSQPMASWQGDLPVFVWGNYEGQLKKAIAALKYDFQRPIGELMGLWLGEAWLNSGNSHGLRNKITVVPIPLHPDKLKSRGFNQAELIARGFCQVTGYGLLAEGLTRVRNTDAMFGLNVQQRAENLKDAFVCTPLLLKRESSSCNILIIDDIYTTGTTVREASKVLRSQGLEVMGVAAIAQPKIIKHN